MLKKVSLGVLGVFVLGFTNLSANQNLYFKNSILKTNSLKLFTSNGFSEDPASVQDTRYWIVQFKDISASEFQSSVSKFVKVIRYVPDNGFIVEIKTSTFDLQLNPHIFWMGPYTPHLKIDQSLLKVSPDQKIFVDIHFFSRSDAHAVQKVKAISKNVLEEGPGLLKVETQRKDLSKLANIDGVEWIEEVLEAKFTAYKNPPIHVSALKPDLSNFEELDGYATGAKALNVEGLYAWDIHGETEIVTITDSGLDTGNGRTLHPDLRGRLAAVYPVGRSETNEWDDPLGHGTHVAGLVAGDGSQSNGEVRGTADRVKLIFQSIFRWITDEDGNREKGMVLPSYLYQIFEEPYEDGSRVHTNSWQYSASGGQYDIQSGLLDYFVWKNPDYTVLFAAGNSGVDLDGDGVIDRGSISTPGTAKNCITVGASENLILKGGIQVPWGILGLVDKEGHSLWGAEPIASDLPSNNLDQIAAFSSRGPTQDGRIKPDVVAPGTNNLSLRSRSPEMDAKKESWGIFNDDYVFMGGTSMATPLVAGAVALVREFYTRVEGTQTVSAALVKATLIHGSRDLNGRPNFDEGFGSVDIENALVAPHRQRISMDETQGVEEGKTKRYELNVKDPSEPLRVTLVYSDFPASPAVAKALVNDLDLTVVGPGGSIFYPNGLNQADDINNVEHIDIEAPQRGKYEVRVSGKSIPIGIEENDHHQPYALVMSGGVSL